MGMSSMSAFLMFIPYSLIGIGEIMVNPVLYYYAYVMTPTKTQCFIQAVNLLFQGSIPGAIVTAITIVLKPFQPNNLNRGHLEFFYYIGIGVCIVGAPLFLLVNWIGGELKDPNLPTEDAENLARSLTGMDGSQQPPIQESRG